MCTSSPNAPAPATAPPAIALPTDPSIQQAVDAERRRQAAAMYQTMFTGGAGVANTNPSAAPKALLGS